MDLITNSPSTTSISRSGKNSSIGIPVRVIDIILDENHPEFEKYNGYSGIGAIKYAFLDRPVNTQNPANLPIAYPSTVNINTFPLKNEVVLLTQGTSQLASSTKSTSTTEYYTTIVNVWNNVNHNASPDGASDPTEVDLGYEFKDNLEVRPLHPFNGDVILQGRHGQGIRFTGAKSPKNTFTGDDNAGKPLTIITNGHSPKNREEQELYLEDINKDLNSIYLASGHIIPLEQSRDKYAAARNRPTLANAYDGNQVIIKGGRLFFDANEEDILLTSKGNFKVSSENISLDGVDYLGLDATKIYLGERALRYELQPAVLGENLHVFMITLLTAIDRIGTALQNAKTVDQKAVPSLITEGPVTRAYVEGLKRQIQRNTLLSSKVYIE